MTRGEIVIVVSGAPAASAALELDADALLRALLEELSPSQAAKIAAHLTGGKRSDLYEAALQLPGETGETQHRSTGADDAALLTCTVACVPAPSTIRAGVGQTIAARKRGGKSGLPGQGAR